jgi:hypothetical protein
MIKLANAECRFRGWNRAKQAPEALLTALAHRHSVQRLKRRKDVQVAQPAGRKLHARSFRVFSPAQNPISLVSGQLCDLMLNVASGVRKLTFPLSLGWAFSRPYFPPFPSIAAILIFIERDATRSHFFRNQEVIMQICMDETLKQEVDYLYYTMKSHNIKYAKTKMIADILRRYELNGDAIQYLNAKGQIAWKATPLLLQKLADVESEDDMDEEDDDDMENDRE